MDLEGIRLSEISQPKKDRHPMVSLIPGIEKEKKENQTQKQRVEKYLPGNEG